MMLPIVSVVLAFFAIAAGVALRILSPVVGRCVNDPEVTFNSVSISPCDVFSETYAEARAKFRKVCPGTLHSLSIYQDYTTDICILQGTAPGLLVHASGVHGVEGYAGSAIQLAFLSGLIPTVHPTMIFVHAVNPYGMANYRRFNENNVDLNRNSMLDFSKVLKRDPNLSGYEDFREFFNLRPGRSFWISGLPLLLRHGSARLKRAIVTGQYHDPAGLFYGGNDLQPSLRKLFDFLKSYLKDNPVASKASWIDVHTGLGPCGNDTLLSLAPRSPSETQKVFEGSLIPGLDEKGDSVAAGYDLMVGATESLFELLFPELDFWFITQEFGTQPGFLVARAMILEHRIRANQLDHDVKKGQELIKEAFYVQTAAWRKSIIEGGLRVLIQSLDWLQSTTAKQAV